jgi:cytidylate kinase
LNPSLPVIALDGPAASGKGAVAARVAESLGFHLLDSGALYRLVALAALDAKVSLDDGPGLAALAVGLDAEFLPEGVRMAGRDATDAIRREDVSAAASRVAAYPAVRGALINRQRAFRKPPGLVADGRDMGTVVFPDAVLKVFLTASAEVRAERRHKQLIAKGNPVNIQSLLRDIRERDARDAARAVAPLQPASDAVLLDTTAMSIDDAARFVLEQYRARAGG